MVSFVENFLLGVFLTLVVGPVMLEVLRRGMQYSFSESLKTAGGVFTAELLYFILIYLGLSSFADSFFVQSVLGFLGVAFLLYLGYENLKDFFFQTNTLQKKTKKSNAFTAGFLITFLNPLNLFMWAGIIGGFFAQSTSFFTASGVLFGILFALFSLTLLSQLGKQFIKESKLPYVSLVSGLFLLFYALRLLFELL